MSEIQKSAVISECQKYRYELRRIWNESAGLVNFIGLNPSTADAEADDPTIRRCIQFARDWGYGGLIMTNLFAYRLTDSKQLRHADAPTGPENWKWLASASAQAKIVVAAWSSHKMARLQGERAKMYLCGHRGVQLMCLSKNKDGSPEHPLYLKADLEPRIYFEVNS